MREPEASDPSRAGLERDRDFVVMDPATAVRRLIPVSKLGSWLTPSEDVYVVAHMGIANVDVTRWRLTVDGLVDRPLVFDYEQLTRLPAREITAVIECFGNPIEPDVPTRRVGNVVWRGVPLTEILTIAGVQPNAQHVWLEGLDSGSFANVYSASYVKDLPLERALEPDVLLAWEMNGEPLTAEHGFPVRAFVPGYFGTNSVKWLSHVHLAETRPDSLYTTRLYNRRTVVGEQVVLEPVRDLDVHSVMVSPPDGATLSVASHVITGWAWGAWPVERVDVSTDGGESWSAARLAERGPGHTWQPFSFDWAPASPGAYELRCRAADSHGRVQPRTGRNRVHTVAVTVR